MLIAGVTKKIYQKSLDVWYVVGHYFSIEVCSVCVTHVFTTGTLDGRVEGYCEVDPGIKVGL